MLDLTTIQKQEICRTEFTDSRSIVHAVRHSVLICGDDPSLHAQQILLKLLAVLDKPDTIIPDTIIKVSL